MEASAKTELGRCARLCEETAQQHVERHSDEVRTDLVSSLLLAAAALDTAAESTDTTAVLIAATLAADAAAAAERRGLDCSAVLRRVAALCERELGGA